MVIPALHIKCDFIDFLPTIRKLLGLCLGLFLFYYEHPDYLLKHDYKQESLGIHEDLHGDIENLFNLLNRK